MTQMKKIWEKIKTNLMSISPRIGESLNDPATQKEIEQLKATIGQELPISFIEYLRTYNGQSHNNHYISFIGHNSLLSIKEIITSWETQINLFGDEEKIEFIKENKVQPVIWDKGRIPFASFNGCDFIVIDLNPGKNGIYGQILAIWPGQDLEDDAIIIADSFEHFSQHILNDLVTKNRKLKNGIIQVNDNWVT